MSATARRPLIDSIVNGASAAGPRGRSSLGLTDEGDSAVASTRSSSGALTWAQAGKVDGLTAFEVTVACGRLAGTAPHLRALATVVEPEQLWRLCREELQGRDLDIDGWIIKPRWFGIVVVSTGRRGRTPGLASIDWRTFAEHLPRGRS